MIRLVQPPSLRNRRVLIVEDEYMIADDMALDLKCFGAEVVGPAASVKTALACLAENEDIDAAVVDINLGGEMAYPVADALTERGVPFLFATGYERWSIPERYSKVVLCEKPVEAASIARALFG